MPFPLPDALELDFWDVRGVQSLDILPTSRGDLFAVRWADRVKGGNLAFVSPSRGQLSALPLSGTLLRAWAFLPSGAMRTVMVDRTARSEEIQFADIDPATGALEARGRIDLGAAPYVRLDGSATRALVIAGSAVERNVTLVQIDGPAPVQGQVLVSARQSNLEAGFLADGRVAVIVRQPPNADLRLFSPDGQFLFGVPLGGGHTTLGAEPFPNTISISTTRAGKTEMVLVDTTSGRVLRRLPDLRPSARWLAGYAETPPPPGTPGAGMVWSSDGKLYLLPSLTEEPRLLLPRP